MDGEADTGRLLAGSTALRAGRPSEARDSIERGGHRRLLDLRESGKGYDQKVDRPRPWRRGNDRGTSAALGISYTRALRHTP